MDTIALFPLGSVLFPGGRMPLQVFEPRYLELISHCLKNDDGFGVVLLREGTETYKSDQKVEPRFAHVGTFARIVDWNTLSNGLLGVTIEGGKKFRLLASYQQDNHLNMAEVEWLPEEEVIPLPGEAQELKGMLLQLMEHPHISRLQLSNKLEDVSDLGNLLAQLLPIDESMKFDLLAMTDPEKRLQQLTDLLDRYRE